MEIGPDGTISIIPLGETADSLAEFDRIKMVKLEPGQLHKGMDGMMRPTDGAKVPADASVYLTTGALEGSNVNTVNSMVDMIELSRRYELQVKMMKTAGDIEESSTSIMRMG